MTVLELKEKIEYWRKSCKAICDHLKSLGTGGDGKFKVIDYSQFILCKNKAIKEYNTSFEACFLPRIFLRFLKNTKGRNLYASVYAISHFIKFFTETEILKIYKKNKNLKLKELEQYIRDQDLFCRQEMVPKLEETGIKICMYKLSFYHKKLNDTFDIYDLICGSALQEIICIRELLDNQWLQCIVEDDWISKANIENLLLMFTTLCENNGKYASFESLSQSKRFLFSPLFINRLLIEKGKENEKGKYVIDFEEYIRFCIAWGDRRSPQAIRYLFPIFDISANQNLASKDILCFVKDILNVYKTIDENSIYEGFEYDLVNEIIDIGTSGKTNADLNVIKERDLVHTDKVMIFGIMADAIELYAYEHREDQ